MFSLENYKRAKKIFKNILNKAIYNRLQKVKINKKKITIRIKFVRRIIKKLIKKIYVIVVVIQ